MANEQKSRFWLISKSTSFSINRANLQVREWLDHINRWNRLFQFPIRNILRLPKALGDGRGEKSRWKNFLVIIITIIIAIVGSNHRHSRAQPLCRIILTQFFRFCHYLRESIFIYRIDTEGKQTNERAKARLR